jgi:hypothetical protein
MVFLMSRWFGLIISKLLDALWIRYFGACADGGDRTHTLLPVLDFESSASANSATSALLEEGITSAFAQKRKRSEFEQPKKREIPDEDLAWKFHEPKRSRNFQAPRSSATSA